MMVGGVLISERPEVLFTNWTQLLLIGGMWIGIVQFYFSVNYWLYEI
jgi:hypothetical protein